MNLKIYSTNLQDRFDLISNCNLYRRQVEYFETLFAKEEFHSAYLSFVAIMEMMISVFHAERRARKNTQLEWKEDIKTWSFFRNSLTRIGK